MDENVKLNEYVSSKCPNCGSELHFLPGTNKVKCVSCGSEFEIESLGQGPLQEEEVNFEETINKLTDENQEMVVQRVIHCQDCGALINLNSKTIATSCPFCGSNRVVEESKQEEIIKINGVVPFALTENDVYDAFHEFIKSKKFAPTKFRNGKTKPTFAAFYIPFYTFDSSTSSNYHALRGDYHYVTRTIHTKNGTQIVEEREVRWTPVSGNVRINFDDIVVRGTSNVLDADIDHIKNFDFTKMQKYQEKYLLGYYGERPSVTLQQGFENGKQIMMKEIKNECIEQIGGDTYDELSFTTNFKNVTFKQIMAPVYNGQYVYNNKTYKFVCNGQTGECSGKAPVSILKVSSLVVILIVFIAIFLYIFIRAE